MTIPVLGVVFDIPTLLPNAPVRIIKGQLPIDIEHLNVGRRNNILLYRTFTLVYGPVLGLDHSIFNEVLRIDLLLLWGWMRYLFVIISCVYVSNIFISHWQPVTYRLLEPLKGGTNGLQWKWN